MEPVESIEEKSLSEKDKDDNFSLMDPAIADIIKDPGCPRGIAPLTNSENLAHIPGKTGFIQGVKTILDIRSTGVKSYLEKKDKFGSIYKDQLALFPVVTVADPAAAGEIFSNKDKQWSASMPFLMVTDGLGYKIEAQQRRHLLSLDFEPHRATRKLIQPAFDNAAMKGYFSILQQSFKEEVDCWDGKQEIAFKSDIRSILSKLSTKLFLGLDGANEVQQVSGASQDFWSAVQALVRHPVFGLTWRKGIRGIDTLAKMIDLSITMNKQKEGDDLVSQLCRIQKQTGELQDNEIIDLMISIIIVAFDTTAFGLTSMAYLLATKPEWQERLREEAFSLPDIVELSDLDSMQQTDWFWKEALRFYPMVPTPTRYSLRDCKLGEYTIPAGTMVLVATGSLGFDSTLWSNPERFDPERFSPQRSEDKRNRYQFMPFGHGAHVCVGMHLTTMEVRLFWLTLLKRYRIQLAKPYDGVHQLRPLGCVSGDVGLRLERI